MRERQPKADSPLRHGPSGACRQGVALLTAMLCTGCGDWLVVPPLNDPSPGGADPVSTVQAAATGILIQNRATYAGYINDAGILGRESFNYAPTDGRSHTHYVAQNPLDPAGFASGGWSPRYVNRRNIEAFLATVDAATTLSSAEKDAARGFALTMDALELSYITAQRHDYGAVLAVPADPRVLAPFVSRDSVHDYVIARLDTARAHLDAAGGASFPFALHAGFTLNGTFNTPATFVQFNRALSARVQAWRAALGNPSCGPPPGATCYTAALAALAEAGIDPSASLSRGVYHIYSAESGDGLNVLSASVYPNLLAHPSVETDAATDSSGLPDARLRGKTRPIAQRCPLGGAGSAGICTTVGFQIYPTGTSPAPIFRNEELILLRAEARYFTGDTDGALADINAIRQSSGGLSPRGSFLDAVDFVTELLAQRRYSLLWEGHRWVDVRRFGRMGTLPLDAPTHYRQVAQPVPQAECLQRVGTSVSCPASWPIPAEP